MARNKDLSTEQAASLRAMLKIKQKLWKEQKVRLASASNAKEADAYAKELKSLGDECAQLKNQLKS